MKTGWLHDAVFCTFIVVLLFGGSVINSWREAHGLKPLADGGCACGSCH